MAIKDAHTSNEPASGLGKPGAGDPDQFENSLVAIPRSDWARFWAMLPTRHVPERLAHEIRYSITEVALVMTTVLGILGFFAAVLVVIAIVPLDTEFGRWWALAHLAVFAYLGAMILVLRRASRAGTLSVSQYNRLLLPQAIGCGVCWGLFPALPATQSAQVIYLATFVSIIYCLAGFFLYAGNWPVSLVYSTTLLGVLIGTFVAMGRSETPLLVVLCGSLVVVSLVVSILVTMGLVKVRLEMVLARERQQLIKLLLQDYERGGHDWIWETDADLRLTRVPPRMTLAGHGDERIRVGTSLLDLLVDAPDALAHVGAIEPFQAHIRTAGPDGRGEIRMWGRPNTISGRCLGYRGVGSDVGAARRSAEAERTRERLDAMVTLTSGLAHDFNNLLATVLGSVELATMYPDVPEPMMPLLERAVDACLRTRRITADLSVASGFDATSQPVVFDVSAAVTDVLFDVRPLYPDVEFDVDIGTPVWGVADKSHFMRALRNLADNGCQAIGRTATGRGTLRVEVGVETNATPVAFVRVHDDGPGIESIVAGHLFEPFISTRKNEGGTGLGLAVSHGFARQAGGSLVVVPSDSGACFQLAIPLATVADMGPELPVAPLAAYAATSTALSGRFLVIDDDEHVAETIRMWIESFGATVEVAGSVTEAVERFAGFTDDVVCVISDLVLPDGAGYEVIAELRRFDPDLRALYVSGFTHTLPADVAPELRCPFVAKPFSSAELLRGLHSAGVFTAAAVRGRSDLADREGVRSGLLDSGW